MPLKLFSEEYNRVRNRLKTSEYADPLKPHLAAVKTALGVDGPDAGCAKKLDELREAVASEEASKIMQSSGLNGNNTPVPQNVEKAATAKFLRHLYYVNGRGSQSVWVFSSPASYSDYPTDEFNSIQSNIAQIKSSLNDHVERFSNDRKKHLGESSLTALNWCLRAQIVLSSSHTSTESMNRVKRWFADDTTGDEQLKTTIATLLAGFKKIANTLNSTQLLYTDMASLRCAAPGTQDKGFLESEAFVYAGRYEKLPIIYIENAFFGSNTNVLSGPKNWARIIVHELSHLDCSTTDEKYAWAGIRPGKGITAEQAAKNADTWAYFAADCAGMLTDGEIKNAMGGII